MSRCFSLCLAAVLLMLCAATWSASAEEATPDPLSSTPIPASACSLINPDPVITSCSQFTQPTTNLYEGLPWTEPAYEACVQQRCVCTGIKDTVDFTPSGYLCDASGWSEDGVFTCDALMQCFSTFWECVTNAVVTRYYTGVALAAAETTLMNEQLTHGSTPGQPFDTTEVYHSCSQITCAATASRRNCGLLTCVPNFTQCYEFIRPPVLPYTHQLCTQGCRAALTMMTVTIFACFMAFLCCCICPARVRVIEPLVTKDDDEDDALGAPKKNRSGPGTDANAASHASGSQHSAQQTQPQQRGAPEATQATPTDNDDRDEL